MFARREQICKFSHCAFPHFHHTIANVMNMSGAIGGIIAGSIGVIAWAALAYATRNPHPYAAIPVGIMTGVGAIGLVEASRKTGCTCAVIAAIMIMAGAQLAVMSTASVSPRATGNVAEPSRLSAPASPFNPAMLICTVIGIGFSLQIGLGRWPSFQAPKRHG